MKPITLSEIQAFHTPPCCLTLWWLGQSGFLIKSPAGKIVALDPYLTNSCKSLGEQVGLDMDRVVPPPLLPGGLVGIDRYILTHSHQDHLDPETLAGYRAHGGHGPYVAPAETVEKLRTLGVPDEEMIMIWPNRQIAVEDLTLRATFAIPFSGDDLTHVGYLVSVAGGPTIYFTGDTSFHDLLAAAVSPFKPDILVTVINGAFRNLGPAEAALLAKQLEVKKVIPCHYDLFRDNGQPPQMLRINLIPLGMGDRFETLTHGSARVFSK